MMADMGKVINGLEYCSKNKMCHWNFPYGGTGCLSNLAGEALELIRELNKLNWDRLTDIDRLKDSIREQKDTIEQLEYELAVANDELRYYVNGNS